MPRGTDVLVVGAGVIGSAVAWRLAQRGCRVTLADATPGAGATHAAAGMLAPVTELHHGELPLLPLTTASARLYPAFVDELERSTGLRVGYVPCGTVQVAWDRADLATLHELHALRLSAGLRSEPLTSGELRTLEPGLASGLPGGLLAPDDHQVDNRALHTALFAAAEREGVVVVRTNIHRLVVDDQRIRGADLADGTRVEASHVVLAAGVHSGQIPGLPPSAQPIVRPVKGQTLRLRAGNEADVSHVIRGSVRGNAVYIVPRADGTVVVGASSEEVGFDLRPRAGAVYELLRDAQALVPALGEAELIEVSTGLRPASADNAPMIGATEVDGLVLATGHYRNGVLLAPLTADAVAALVTTGDTATEVAAFSPARFVRT